MILSLYAGMMRAGISMADADRTDLGRYLRVMGHVVRQQIDHTETGQMGHKPENAQKSIVYLKRGTIDQIM